MKDPIDSYFRQFGNLKCESASAHLGIIPTMISKNVHVLQMIFQNKNADGKLGGKIKSNRKNKTLK